MALLRLKRAVAQARPLPDYGYFDHGADVGVIGRGDTPESSFVSAARATFALLTPLEPVEPRAHLAFEFEEPDLELALVRWLNLLLALAADRGLALGRFALRREGDAWKGEAWGEPWRDGLERGTGVKGATLTMLSVAHGPCGWEARCVVDV